MPDTYAAAPAGSPDAGPRPDLRGHRLAVAALLERPQLQLHRKRLAGLVAGFAVGIAAGAGLLAVGAPLIVAIVLAAAGNYLAALWVPVRLLSTADRALLAVGARLATSSGAAWRRTYGSVPMPTTEERRLLWIAAQPPTTTDPDALDIEGSVLLGLGRYGPARERAERIPAGTPWQRFVRLLALALIEFESRTGPGDLAPARESAAAIHGDRRSNAVAILALEEAARDLIRGDDWGPAIQGAVSETGRDVAADIGFGLARTRSVLAGLAVSELALAAVLAILGDRPIG
jgi:hypothetical protein